MGEYLRFHKMVTPVVIQVIFWLVATIVVVAGVLQLRANTLAGLALIVLGPLVVRIYAELLIVLFEINDAVQDMRSASRGGGTAVAPAHAAPGSAPTT